MKKLPKQIYASLPSVSLYLKDIEILEEIFKSNCKFYTIVTEEYEFESLEQLKQLEKLDFEEIRFKSQEPQVSLKISSLSTSSFISEDNAISVGILTKIKEILEARVVPSISEISSRRATLNFIVSIVSFIVYLQNIIIIDVFVKYIILIIQIGSLIVINSNLIFKADKDKITVIIAKDTSKKTNFFLEHKNQIILLIIGGLITLVVQVLVQWIKQKIFSP
jgi:hypothetical protein